MRSVLSVIIMSGTRMEMGSLLGHDFKSLGLK